MRKILLSVYALPVTLIFVLAGCTSPNAANQIKSFSDATILTISNTTQAFKLVEDSHFKEQVSDQVLNYDKKPGFNPEVLQPFMPTNALQVRLDVLNGLKLYAANLSALMGNSAMTNLDQETTKLGQALAQVDTNLVSDSFFKQAPASTTEIQIFTTAINALGHWVIDYKRTQDAKELIASMQQPVSNICVLLQKDFYILGSQLQKDQQDTLRHMDLYVLNNLNQFNNSPGEKRATIEEMADFTEEMNTDAAIFLAMESSAEKLEAAHSALLDVFSNNTTTINSLINELSTQAQSISTYYQSLKSAK